jgi:ATP-binding protein involved in chromosome partitioning
MIDPRLEIIDRRLGKIRRIIAVSSGKGGVGKSVVASALAFSLKERGYSVGLLDLDFTSPSTHIILGVEGMFPEEEYGIIPPLVNGLRYMSITYYALDKPAPLRGADVSDAIIELLAITRWGELDYLVVDMPPGIGDANLDVIRLIRGIRFLTVTTPSRVAYETIRKQLSLLRQLKVPVIGVIENMVMKPSAFIRKQVEVDGARYLGSVGYDYKLEDAIGNVKKFSETEFFASVSKLVPAIE